METKIGKFFFHGFMIALERDSFMWNVHWLMSRQYDKRSRQFVCVL